MSKEEYSFFVPPKLLLKFTQYVRAVGIKVRYVGYSGKKHYYSVVSDVSMEDLNKVEYFLNKGRKSDLLTWYPQSYIDKRIKDREGLKEK